MPGEVSSSPSAADPDDWAEDLYDDDRLGYWPEGGDYRQSDTACCPRESTPDSCSCADGCHCLCLDCNCDIWGEEDEDG